jgi:hypothetical protein
MAYRPFDHALDDLPVAGSEPAELGSLRPSQVAAFIRGLDSRLAGMDYVAGEGHARIVYTFAIAGKRQSFQANVSGKAVESIAPWYPEAAELERRLHQDYGITFAETPAGTAEDAPRGSQATRREGERTDGTDGGG